MWKLEMQWRSAVWATLVGQALSMMLGCGTADGQLGDGPGEGTGVVRQAVGPTAPIGNHEGIWAEVSTSRYFSEGWTCDPDGWSASLVMDFYMDGTFSTGSFVQGFVANALRPDVVNVCGGTTNHGWHMYIPDDSRWLYGSHTLYGYAINDNDVGPHPMLGSPSFTYYKIAGNVGQSGVTVSVGPRSAVSDASGNYTIVGLVSNTWTVTPSKAGCTFSPSAQSVTVGPDGLNKNFTINCGPTTFAISGSAGTASATMAATGGYSATADAVGNYTLGALPAGTYTVTAAKPGCTFTPASRQVTVGPNATGQSFTASCWSGPTVTLVSDSERKKLRICPQGGGSCDEGVPLFLTLNTQTAQIKSGSWTDFDYQLNAMESHLWGVAGVVPIIEVHLFTSTDQTKLSELISHLNNTPHPPYLILRWYIEASSSELLTGVNLAGQTSTQSFPSINASWVAAASTEIQSVLGYVDQHYPGKVIGVKPLALVGGEWFMEPRTADGQSPDPGTPGVPSQWGSMPNFYYPDVSSSVSSEFCAWSGLPGDLVPGCRLPTLAERNGGVSGGTTPPSFVLDPSNLTYKRAAYFSQHQSVRLANAINQLAATAKTFTGNRILTVAVYGYLFGREWNLGAGGHLGLKALLGSSAIDVLVAPLNYGYGRDMGEPFVPQGPLDSPALYNKLWIHEDDTRTLFADPDAGYKFASSVSDTNSLLRRNAIASMIHGNGLYWIDLQGGWFGKPAFPSETDQIWTSLADVVAQSNRISTTTTSSYTPQIAVFVDDLSPAYMPVINPAGEASYDYAVVKTYSGVLDALSRIGAPYRVYRLDDLQQANFPAVNIKLAIFLNAWNVSASNRTAITNKLKVAGKTLLFIQGAGYLKGDIAPSVANIQDLTGITTSLGATTLPTLQIDPSITASANYGPEYPITPWFYFTGATDLGRYVFDTTKSALAKQVFPVTGGSYTVIHSASPGMTTELYRQFASDAGVAFFTTTGNVVEARGNTLMVQVKSAGARTITLPFAPSQLFMNTGSGESLCSTQSVCLTRSFAANEVAVYRWQ